MKISIITVCYNSGSTIRDTFESVLSQTYSDIEYIVVDGGSTDGSLEIIRRYEALFDGKMRWISEPDKGLYDAMNKGISLCSGNIVGILNSDDFFTSHNVLEKVAQGIGDADAVYGDVHYVKEANLDKCVRYYSSRTFKPWLMRLGFMPAHPSFYCRKKIYERLGGYDTDFKVAADFELLLRFILIHNISTHYLPLDFVTMRTGGASSSGFKSHRQIFHDHRRAFHKNGIYSNWLLEGCRYLYKLGEVSVSRLLFR